MRKAKAKRRRAADVGAKRGRAAVSGSRKPAKPARGGGSSGKPSLANSTAPESPEIPPCKRGLVPSTRSGAFADIDLPGLCSKLGIKHAQLARLLNTHPNTVTKWNRGALVPDEWRLVMLREFGKAAVAGFSWRGRGHSYSWRHRDPAADSLFELPKVPERLREILAAAKPAAKDSDAKAGKGKAASA